VEKTAIKAAREAGRILLDNFGRIKKVEVKKRGDLVTNVDVEAEEKIIKIINGKYPEHFILSEESKELKGNSDYRWIIDPLDGTHNYVRGIEIFGVSIALEHKGSIILGVIYMPCSDELYFAERGEGAYLNGERIKVSRRGLSQALLVYDSNIKLGKEHVVKGLDMLARKTFALRMFGSSVRTLSYIAEGKADIFIDYHHGPWDFSAGALLVEEAGGKLSDIYGNPWSPWVRGYIASNGVVHEEVVKTLSISFGK